MVDGVLQLDLPRPAGDGAGYLPSFVVGPENRLVVPPITQLLAANERERASLAFNPLVLVGPAGSGKSHLVQAVVRTREGSEAVAYFTAADFARDCHAASDENRLEAWRASLRSLDLLVVEDLEAIRPHSPAQWELRQAIDAIIGGALHDKRPGVVIVTADREPASLGQLNAGLRDRLAGGLLVRVERPGPAARRAILTLAAESRGISLSDKDLERLANREVGAVQHLLGALVRHARPDLADDSEPADVQLKQILAATARYFGVTQAALVGSSRQASLVRARNVAAYLSRQLTNLSFARIGRELGGRDHTTIMHACDRLAEQAAADPALRQAVDDLDRLLR